LSTFAATLGLAQLTLLAEAQNTPPAQPAAAQPPPADTGTQTATFSPEELEAVVAPIALYPDALLAQIFMASTYPLEVVEAARWSKEHPDVKGDAVGDAVKDQTWDASVKSLVAFPQVLTMMNEKLDWTQKLGDAFLADQAGTMQAVQRLRNKAHAAGNLKSTKEMTVKTEPAPAQQPAAAQPAAAAAPAPAPQTIIIESKDPEVVYVPQYDPVVVYGAWSYPAYPPYYYYPPGYAAGAAFWSFTAGVIVGGALWGNCNWGGNDVDIDINRENNFTRNTNRETNRTTNRSGDRSSWQHDSSHRKGVGYRDSATQQKFGGGSERATQAREQYRGRAEQGRDQIQREGVGNQRDLSGNQIGSRDTRSAQSRDVGGGQGRDLGGGNPRDAGGQRAGGNTASSRDVGSSSRGNTASSRDLGSSSRGSSAASSRGSSASRGSSSAFGGAGSGASTRSSASRGSASRSSAGMRGGGGRRR